MSSREHLIDKLSAGVAPVAAPPNLSTMSLLWLVASFVYVGLVTLIYGPLRTGFSEQLISYPRFAAEMVLGLGAIFALGFAFVRSAVPGALSKSLRGAALVLVALWLGSILYGLHNPAMPLSMSGKRPYCVFETFIYALPPLFAGLFLQRKLFSLRPLHSAAIAGLAAGLIPAWLMQVACMYDPGHALSFHITPGLLVAIVAMPMLAAWRHVQEIS